jgi:uncharacterized protein YcbX
VRTVARLSTTPVKSMQLHHPERVRLERFGVPENRRFYVAQPDGALFNGTKLGTLVAIRAEYDGDDSGARPDGSQEWLSLHFPDGRVVEGDPTQLDRPVQAPMYGRAVSGHVLTGPWNEALSLYAGRPLVLIRPEHAGDGNDSAPVSLFSTASARELAERAGSVAALDSRRFRMLIEVGGCQPHEEDAWIGRRVRVGEAVLLVERPVARCVITTQDPSTGLKDFDTLKALAAYRGFREGTKVDFGVYAQVLKPGAVGVGDPVEPEDR